MPGVTAFQPEPPEAGLDPKGQQSLESFLRSQAANKRLQERLDRAMKRLMEMVGSLNDRATQENSDFQSKVSHLAQNGEVVDGADQREHDAFQRKAVDLTKNMDHAMRKAIDSGVCQAGLQDVLKQVSEKSNALSQAAQLQQRQSNGLNRRRAAAAAAAADGGEDGETDAMDVQDDNDGALPLPQPADAPSALLRDGLSKNETSWAARTLTQRYSKDNDYTGFYTALFYAKNPGDEPPPVPHADFWFAEEEGREIVQPGQRPGDSGVADGEADGDLVVASERVGITCPLTLLPYTDPWTSKKCPHSFEKEGIFTLIQGSVTFVEFTPEQRAELNLIRDRHQRYRKEKELRIPQARCPVCTAMLTMADLEPNPLLLRKTKRVLEQRRREEEGADGEDSSDEDQAPRGTQRRPVGLGSSPPTRAKMEQIKRERAAATPTSERGITSTQTTAAGATVVELGTDDEEMTDDG